MESVTSLPVGALTSEPTSATSEISVKLPLSSGAGQENLFDHALMARAYLSEGRFDEAERLYKLALDVSQDFYGASHGEVAPHLENLSSFYVGRARYQQARPYLERLYALRLSQRSFGSDRYFQPLLATVEQLSLVLEHLCESEQAEKLYLATLRAAEKDFGSDSEHTLSVLGKLGEYYSRTGVYVAARAVFEELLDILSHKHGANSLELSAVLSQLSEVYGRLALYYDRIAVLERQVEITECVHNGTGVALASQLVRLGEALSVAAKHYQCKEFAERAHLIYCRALSIYERFNGANTPTIQGLRAKLIKLAAGA